ncbi:MAG: hypothetical protein K0V04_22540 [Deltaproteobacteria bacterium]|nr:hypothetical protein [Deltaproteobacteria bacterium]
MHTQPTLTTITLATLALLCGCPSDDTAPAETDSASSGSSTGGSSTGTDPDSGSSSSSSSTTEAADDTTTDDGSSTGDPPGICVGIDVVGDIGSVYARDGLPIDPVCDPIAAGCGGDVVGTWILDNSCGYEQLPNEFEDRCPGSTFLLEIVAETATVTFVDDGTFTQSSVVDSQAVLTLDPMACFGASCEEFDAVVAMDDPNASCEDIDGLCTCVLPNPQQASNAEGTYVVENDLLTVMTKDEQQELTFCVADDRLSVWEPLLDFTVTEQTCADDADCEAALGDAHAFYACIADDGE